MHIILIPSAAPSFKGIWAIWSPLKIHCYTCMSFETCWSRLIYTKLSSHRWFVINMYVITMAWHCISPWSFYRSLQKRREIDIFRICQQISAHSEVKTTEKKRGKPWLNARKHWKSESINRNLSAAVLHVKPSCNNSNLNDIGISLQRADLGSYHFLVTGTKIISNHLKTVRKLLENLHKVWWGETYHCRSAIESINVSLYVLLEKIS